MLHRIKNILSIEPYYITCEWMDGEVRTIEMENILKEWSKEPDSVFNQLLEPANFITAKLDEESKTLYWNNILPEGVLDLCPDTLYEISYKS